MRQGPEQRFVLDTNVLVSAALGDGAARRLLRLLAQRGGLVTSRFILDELLRVFQASPHLARRVPPLAAARLAAFVERHAQLVDPQPLAWDDNPGDAAILGTGLAAGCPIATGDRRILEQAGRFGARAVAVQAALEALDE